MPFPITSEQIDAAEGALGTTLPKLYRAAIERSNGGEREAANDIWQLHPIEDRSDRKRIARTANHIGLETLRAREWARFPRNGFSIASNGSGDHLVLLQEGNTMDDTVYLWYHEHGQLTRLAASIQDLGSP